MHDPFLQVIREGLPQIGAVRHASISYCQYSSRYDAFRAGDIQNAFNPALGNAALMDIGIYCLHVCLALFGVPKAVAASSCFLENGMEASGAALFTYPNLPVTITYSKVTASVFPSQIYGEDGSMTFDTLNQPSFVKLHRRGFPPERLPFATVPNNMVYLLKRFRDCVQGGDDADALLEHSVAVLRIADEIRRKAGIHFGDAERA